MKDVIIKTRTIMNPFGESSFIIIMSQITSSIFISRYLTFITPKKSARKVTPTVSDP